MRKMVVATNYLNYDVDTDIAAITFASGRTMLLVVAVVSVSLFKDRQRVTHAMEGYR